MLRDLGFGYKGNGLVVYDRLHEKNGDYMTVAHINPDRKICYYEKLGVKDIKLVEEVAACSDPCVSFTQELKIFTNRPLTA